MGKIELKDIYKKFDKQVVVDHMTLTIPDQSFTVILGPSGCGKSTLLRLISGLEEVEAGEILIDNRDVTYLEPKERKISMVFQNYALYPHMTAYKNIEYGLKIQGVKKEQRKEKVLNALKMVELEDQANKLPAQMSGGQRQRVALARAMVKSPVAYLMDEPLSNLDARLRNQMRQTISTLHAQLNKTFVYVTHDQLEAMSMGDNIIILNKGKIMQQGTPKEIYMNPANLFVAKFIGSPPTNIVEHNNVFVGIRPEHILIDQQQEQALNLTGHVISVELLGSEAIYQVKTTLGELLVKTENTWKENNKSLSLTIPLDKIMYFDQIEQRIYDYVALEAQLLSQFNDRLAFATV